MYLKKELYELIRTDEKVFDFILDSSLDGLWYWDLENPENEWMNARFWTVLGYNPDEMPHKSSAWQSIINQDDLKVANDNFTKHCLDPHHPYDQNVRYTHKNGSTIWIRCRGLAIRDATGKPIRMLGAHQDISDIKRNELELSETLERFKALHNASFGGIAIHDQGKILECNNGLSAMTGYSVEELMGMDGLLLISPQDRERVMTKIISGYEKPYEASGLRKNGEQFPMRLEARNIPYKGKTVRTTEFRDLTETKQAEQALRESELKFRALFEKGPIGVAYHKMVYDATGAPIDYLFLDANQSYQDLTGVDPTGKLVTEAFPGIEKDPFNWIGVFAKVARSGETVRFEGYLEVNQRWYDCVGYQYKPDHFVAAFLEITKRKNAELQLQEINKDLIQKNAEIEFNNARLESLLKISQYTSNSIQELLDYSLNEAIILTQSKIGYIYFFDENTQQFTLNSWSKEVMKECMVRNPQTVYDLSATGCWGEAVRQRKPILINDYLEENPIIKGTPNGHIQLKKFLTIPVIIDQKIVAVCGVANKETDYDNSDVRQLTLLMDSVWKISERISLIKELTAAKEKAEESDRLKSAFLANMSHEIRTPMNGILGFAELMKEPGLTGEEQQSYINIIEKSGTRLLSIINDIVDISRIEAGLMNLDVKETNMNEQIEDIHSFFLPETKRRKLGFKKHLPDQEIIIRTDPEKVYAILTNLVKNAIKYTNEGTIELGINVSAESNSGNLELYVKDTGIGIPKERQEAIFERFVRADIADRMAYQGAGLGLSISRAYLEMLGGKIWVDSDEGAGSTFYFTLPWSSAPKVPSYKDSMIRLA